MGRAVTAWYMEDGVRLVGLHPPDSFPKWLNPMFYEELRKTNWSMMLENGHNLYLGTARAAEKIIFQQ